MRQRVGRAVVRSRAGKASLRRWCGSRGLKRVRTGAVDQLGAELPGQRSGRGGVPGGSMRGRFRLSRGSAGLGWRGRKESEGSIWGFRAPVKTVVFILGVRSNWKVKSASHQLNFTCKIFLSSLLLSTLALSHGSGRHAQGSLPLPPRFSLLLVWLSSLHSPASPYQSP